jgi:flavin-dependent dehydrogenase
VVVRYDVIVVGGRVAGCASALLMARRGARVLVLERGAYGSDTLSTHFVWPRGARRLAEMGILDDLLGQPTPPIRTITFDPGVEAVLTWRPKTPALCPRRTTLDRLLVDAAVAAGVEVRHRTTVDGLLWERARVRGVRVASSIERADLVVGADGRLSDVARFAGAEVLATHEPQTAGFYAYFERLEIEAAEFRVREGRLTYAWPTNDGLACVYVAGRAAEFSALRERVHAHGLQSCAIEDASLASRLAAARPASRLHGFAQQGSVQRQRSGPGWVLVGDAASFKDPTAGMGISEALEDAAWVSSGESGHEREREAARIAEFCHQAATLARVDTHLADAYRRAAQSRALSEALFEVLGGECEPEAFFRGISTASR